MRALIVYESMYGNTHAIADAICDGMRPGAEVQLVPVAKATPEQIGWAELLVVGGPTHIHGMSSASSRHSAAENAAKPGSTLHVEPDAVTLGLRDWLAGLPAGAGKPAVAFDTRLKGPAIFTGRASSGIAKALKSHGFDLVEEPESFLVTSQTVLVEGELDRAREWGTHLVGGLVPVG